MELNGCLSKRLTTNSMDDLRATLRAAGEEGLQCPETSLACNLAAKLLSRIITPGRRPYGPPPETYTQESIGIEGGGCAALQQPATNEEAVPVVVE